MHPIATSQQTDLDISKIIIGLQGDMISPSANYVNDIGVIFLNSDFSSKTTRVAERVLIKFLSSNNEKLRYIAYCQLKRANDTATNTTHDALQIFQANKLNNIIVELAQTTLWL